MHRIFDFIQSWWTTRRIRTDAHRVALRPEEKNDARAALVAFMDAHPLPTQETPVPAPRWSLFPLPLNLRPIPVLLVLILSLSGSGALAYAAEDTLPGDLLYPVKVRVTEPIVAALTFSPRAKVEVQTRFATRRLEEVERLAQKGTLTAAGATALTQAFTSRMHAATAAMERIPTDANAPTAPLRQELRADLAVRVRVHKKILEAVSEQTTEEATKQSLQQLTNDLENTLGILAVEEADESMAPTPQPLVSVHIAERKRAAAQRTIKSANDLVNSALPRLGKRRTAKAKNDIKRAQEKIDQGNKKQEAGLPSAATQLFEEARQVAEETKTLTDVELKLNMTTEPGDQDDTTPQLNIVIETTNRVFASGEPIEIILTVTNIADTPVTLHFPTSCPVTYTIDKTPPEPQFCAQVLTDISIAAHDTHTWRFAHTTALASGRHTIQGLVIGYGDAETTVVILPPQASQKNEHQSQKQGERNQNEARASELASHEPLPKIQPPTQDITPPLPALPL